MIVNHIQIFLPTVFITESIFKQIDHRDIKILDWPDNCYAVRFWDREELYMNGKLLTISYHNPSPTYFKNASILSIKEIEQQHGSKSILYQNMKINHWDKVIKTSSNNFFPLQDDYVLI